MDGTEQTPNPSCVLLVDDDPGVRTALARVLRRAGHIVEEREDGRSALARCQAGGIDVVLTDITMPQMSGIDLLRALRASDPDTPVVLMTGAPEVDTAVRAVRLGAIDYLTKPVDLDSLKTTVTRAVGLGRLARAGRATHVAVERAAAEVEPSDERPAAFERALASAWPAFQPIVGIDGSLYGFEALLRTREPAFPNPGVMIAEAERLGRVADMGRVIRRRSAEAFAAAPADAHLFVNLHPSDLFDDELTSPESALRQIAPRVVLEITERAALESFSNARERVEQLRSLGFRIAIDDLGAGYAGLTSFAVLEPEVVKLDMTLVRGVDAAPTKQKVIRSFATLGRDLGMLVIAEGVETVGELETLRTLGCDLLQGYLIARPGPAFPTISWPRMPAHAASGDALPPTPLTSTAA